MKKILLIIIIIVIVSIAWKFVKKEIIPTPIARTFKECLKYSNAVMKSYPRQCRDSEGNLFIENIGNKLKKIDLTKINTPRPNQEITSPVLIKGEWFAEAKSV